MATLLDQVNCIFYRRRWRRYNTVVAISLDRRQIFRLVPYLPTPAFVVDHRFGCVAESGARLGFCSSFGVGHEAVAQVLQ